MAAPASDYVFVSDQSDLVVVSGTSPMSDGFDQFPSSRPLLCDQQDSEVVVSSNELQPSSSGLTDRLHTVVTLDGTDTEPVVVPQALYLGLDASWSMRGKVPKVIKSVDERTKAANNAGIPVTMVIFSDEVICHKFEAGTCPRLTSELYSVKGNTSLNLAVKLVLETVAGMPTSIKALFALESDGINNVGGVTILELRQQLSALKLSHPDFSTIMCSSGVDARQFASEIGLAHDQVIQLDEKRRDCGAIALSNAQDLFFSSDPGSIASFGCDDIARSEPQADSPRQWPSHGSSYVDNFADFANDCVPTPGPNVSYWNGSGRANDDFQSEY
jgi:hypothetical protein